MVSLLRLKNINRNVHLGGNDFPNATFRWGHDQTPDSLIWANANQHGRFKVEIVHASCAQEGTHTHTHSDTLTSRTLFSLSSSLSWASLSLRTASSLLMSSAANLSGSTWMSFGMRYVRCIRIHAQKWHTTTCCTELMLKINAKF